MNEHNFKVFCLASSDRVGRLSHGSVWVATEEPRLLSRSDAIAEVLSLERTGLGGQVVSLARGSVLLRLTNILIAPLGGPREQNSGL